MITRVWVSSYGRQISLALPKNNIEGIDDGDYVDVKLVKPPLLSIKIKCPRKDCEKKYADHTVKELYEHGLILWLEKEREETKR